MARRRERHEAGGRGRVVDDSEPTGGQPEPFGQPGHYALLELRYGRRGPPQHAVRVERGGDGGSQDSGNRAGVREVGEEARVVPVADSGEDQLVEIREQFLERPSPLRARFGQPREEIAGLRARQHGQLGQSLEVADDPLECGLTVAAQLCGSVGGALEVVGAGRGHGGWASEWSGRRPSSYALADTSGCSVSRRARGRSKAMATRNVPSCSSHRITRP